MSVFTPVWESLSTYCRTAKLVHIVNMDVVLLKALAWSKVKITRHLIDDRGCKKTKRDKNIQRKKERKRERECVCVLVNMHFIGYKMCVAQMKYP